jgi:hypothetical protein
VPVEPSATTPAIDAVEQVALPPIRPGSGWYGVGGAVIALGLLGAFLLLTAGAFGYLRAIDDLQRVPVPGDDSLVLPGGEVVVYHEPAGGPVLSAAALGLTIGTPQGDDLPLDASEGDEYAVEARAGVEVGRVDVPTGGEHVVGTTDGTGELAIGPPPGRQLTAYGVGALALAALAVVGGLAILLVVRRRRRAAIEERHRAQRERRVARLA